MVDDLTAKNARTAARAGRPALGTAYWQMRTAASLSSLADS